MERDSTQADQPLPSTSGPTERIFDGAELESISNAIMNGYELDEVLQLVVKHTTDILEVERAYIFLKDEETNQLNLKAASDNLSLEKPVLASTESLETWVLYRDRPLALPSKRSDISSRGQVRYSPPIRRSALLKSEENESEVVQAAVPIRRSDSTVGVLVVIDSRLNAKVPTTPPPGSNPTLSIPAKPAIGSQLELAPVNELIPFLSVFADLVSLALENRQILKRQNRRNQLIDLLKLISQNSFKEAHTNLKEIAATLADQIAAASGAEKVDIMLHSPQTDELVTLGTSNTPLSQLQVKLGLDHISLATSGRLAQVYMSGKSFLSGKVEKADQPDQVEKLGIQSLLVVPLPVDQTPQGVISLSSTQAHSFDEDDLSFINFVSLRMGYLLRDGKITEELAEAENIRILADERENFIAVVAHDLKNALAVLRGTAQINLRKQRQGDFSFSQRSQQITLTKANQALVLVEDMVSVSQIEQGSFRLFRSEVELVSLMVEEVEALEIANVPRVFNFQTNFKEVLMNADAGRLRQVISNLLNNAVRYSPPETPIDIKIEPGPPLNAFQTGPDTLNSTPIPLTQGPVVKITVSDQGMGISLNDQAHIFDRFYRGRGAQVTSGSGLGLYISREIVMQHGGQLWVTSQEGVGSQFQILYPVSVLSELDPLE